MRQITYDPNKADEEASKKLRQSREDEKRQKYLDMVRENRNFQKYIVEDIIKKNINELTDIRNIKNADLSNLEEVGRLVVQAKASRLILEKILSDIMN